MASEVRSGTSNPSYTNNTGQNVRIVINYMASAFASQTIPGGSSAQTFNYPTITISWAGVSVRVRGVDAIGRNLAFATTETEFVDNPSFHVSSNMLSVKRLYANTQGFDPIKYGGIGALPTELMLADGQTFSAVCGAYNIVIIPEA